jgi:hypothetical protein
MDAGCMHANFGHGIHICPVNQVGTVGRVEEVLWPVKAALTVSFLLLRRARPLINCVLPAMKWMICQPLSLRLTYRSVPSPSGF